jgi:ABC-type transporter Mla subunit MlaD
MNKSKYLKKRKATRKTRKNKKIYYGGKDNNVLKNENGDIEREGVIDMIGDKVSKLAVAVPEYAAEKGLRLVGLEPIKGKEGTTDSNGKVDESTNNTSNTTSGIMSDIKEIGSDLVEVVNKTTGTVIENVNEVLDSPQVNKTIVEAASDTAEIGEKMLEEVNEKINTPEFREQTKIALDNAAELATVGLEAMDKPINKAIDKLNDAGSRAASGFFSGLIKTGTDLAGAVPYVGAVIDIGKAVNDGSKAVSSVIEAGSEAVETTSDLIIETNENIKSIMKKLDEKKNEAMDIANRTKKSINQFEKPLQNISSVPGISKVPTTSSGGSSARTKKRLLKHKVKSKRVRFAI